MVEAGTFRDDLFFRLRVIEIAVPPLRDRRSDIPLLVRHILSKAAMELGRQVPRVSNEVMAELISREWPGNVRELENSIIRAMVMTRGPALSLRDIEGDHWRSASEVGGSVGPVKGQTLVADLGAGSDGDQASLAAVERRHVQRVLLMTRGNKSAAARILEVSRPTLNRMIKEYGIVLP
jgi:DNA-binding NtrC family response regulator